MSGHGGILRRKAYNVYNRMPYEARSRISGLARFAPPTLVFGREYARTLSLVRRTERLSSEEMGTLVRGRLEDILILSLATPWYGTRMSAAGIGRPEIMKDPEGVLASMDFVEKADMNGNEAEFLSVLSTRTPRDHTSTGGTSGEPFYFFMDSSRSAVEWAYFTDMWGRAGYTPYSRRASFRGSRIHPRGFEDDWITRERRFSSFNLTHDYLDRMWPRLEDYSPEFIYAYPSTAMDLCKYMAATGRLLPQSVKGFLLGSENIYDGQREYIDEVSGLRATLWYGHSEKLVLAGECEKSSLYHAYPLYGHAEFITESGQPAKPGEFAEIVGTGFINTVMPFVRYRTGDWCTYVGDRCPHCGRNFHVFKDVRGRWTQEVLFGAEGNRICMSAVNVHSDSFKRVFRYQFHQDKPGRAELRIMPRPGFTDREERAILSEFNKKLGGSVVVSARRVDDIPLTDRGKYRFIDQRLDDAAATAGKAANMAQAGPRDSDSARER